MFEGEAGEHARGDIDQGEAGVLDDDVAATLAAAFAVAHLAALETREQVGAFGDFHLLGFDRVKEFTGMPE